MTCEKRVSEILGEMGLGKLLQNQKYSEKIKNLCDKKWSEYMIVSELIKDYLIDEVLMKDHSLSEEERSQLIREIKGEDCLEQSKIEAVRDDPKKQSLLLVLVKAKASLWGGFFVSFC